MFSNTRGVRPVRGGWTAPSGSPTWSTATTRTSSTSGWMSSRRIISAPPYPVPPITTARYFFIERHFTPRAARARTGRPGRLHGIRVDEDGIAGDAAPAASAGPPLPGIADDGTVARHGLGAELLLRAARDRQHQGSGGEHQGAGN